MDANMHGARQMRLVEELRGTTLLHRAAEEIRDLQAKVDRLTTERDQYGEAFNGELSGALDLRQKYGAQTNETFDEFLSRLVSERDEARKCVIARSNESWEWRVKFNASQKHAEVVSKDNAELKDRLLDSEAARQSHICELSDVRYRWAALKVLLGSVVNGHRHTAYASMVAEWVLEQMTHLEMTEAREDDGR